MAAVRELQVAGPQTVKLRDP